MKQELQKDEVKCSRPQGITEFFSHSLPHLIHFTRNLVMVCIPPYVTLCHWSSFRCSSVVLIAQLFQLRAKWFLFDYILYSLKYTTPYTVCQEENLIVHSALQCQLPFVRISEKTKDVLVPMRPPEFDLTGLGRVVWPKAHSYGVHVRFKGFLGHLFALSRVKG